MLTISPFVGGKSLGGGSRIWDQRPDWSLSLRPRRTQLEGGEDTPSDEASESKVSGMGRQTTSLGKGLAENLL